MVNQNFMYTCTSWQVLSFCWRSASVLARRLSKICFSSYKGKKNYMLIHFTQNKYYNIYMLKKLWIIFTILIHLLFQKPQILVPVGHHSWNYHQNKCSSIIYHLSYFYTTTTLQVEGSGCGRGEVVTQRRQWSTLPVFSRRAICWEELQMNAVSKNHLPKNILHKKKITFSPCKNILNICTR